MTSLLDTDNAGDDYVAHRQKTTDRDIVQNFLRQMESEDAAEAKPTGDVSRETKPEGEGGGVLEKAGRVGKDMFFGAIESPRQIVGGVSDAVHNVFTAGDSLANWLNENVADLKVEVPLTGVDALDRMIANPAKEIAGKKGEVAPAETTTGGFTREAARFLTGFKFAKGVVGGGFAGIPAGALTDFTAQDPDAKRLVDIWKQFGLPENVLTDYLASDPTDTEGEKRFKNALEGAALGSITEGLFLGGRYIRAKWQARRTAQQAGLQQLDDLATVPKVTDRDFLLLGDPNEPLVKVSKAAEPEALASARRAGKLTDAMKATETGVPADVTAKGIVGAAKEGGKLAAKETLGEPAVMVNFARINTGDDVKQVISDMAESFAPKIDKARRGKITNEATKELADKLGLTVGDLLQRRQGQPFNAETAVAARELWASSAEKLLESAKAAAAPNAGAVDQFNFRKMMAVHYAVQAEVIGARTETARALQSWRIPAGGGAEKAQAIQTIIDGMGGPQVTQAMAQRLALLAQVGASDEAIAQFARKGFGAVTMDAVKEAWVNALLSSPTTHIVNTASNSMVAAMQVYERMAAEGIASFRGAAPGQGVAAGESGAMLYGLLGSTKDAFRAAAKAARTGQSEMAGVLGKVDLPGQFSGGAAGAVSTRAFNLDEAGAIGRTVDFLGGVLRVPGRLMATEDEFFKTIGYRAELHAQAFRQAASEGLQGAKLGERIARIIADPPEGIRMAAADAALYSTFTNQPGWFGQAALNLRSAGGAANPMTFILPFVRTPVNIARFAFERSPLAPAVRQWRADIAAGGARADLALARMATGTTAMLLTADLAMSGMVSGRGPKDQGEREAMQRQGWQPYSLKVEDRWYSYNRSDPFGMTMGFAADFTEAMNRGEIDPDDVDEWQEVMASMIGAVAQVSVSKTYLSGLANFFEMMSDPARYGPVEINRLLGSFVPSGVATVERFIDPVTREASDPYEAIVARLPGLSEKLTPRRDLWGEEMRPRSGLGTTYDVFSPVQASEIRDSPADKAIQNLGADVRRIGKKTSFQGVDVNFRDWPEVYDAYVRLAGNELKHPAWGMGAKDFLDAVVEGRHPMSEVYKLQSDGKDGGKSEFIRDTVRSYRELAQRHIMNSPEFADFRDHVKDRGRQRIERALPGGIKLPQ